MESIKKKKSAESLDSLDTKPLEKREDVFLIFRILAAGARHDYSLYFIIQRVKVIHLM